MQKLHSDLKRIIFSYSTVSDEAVVELALVATADATKKYLEACLFDAHTRRLEDLMKNVDIVKPYLKLLRALGRKFSHVKFTTMTIFFMKKSLGWYQEFCTYAVEMEDERLLKWLRTKGCPWSSDATAKAAEIGGMCMLRLLVSKGCRLDDRASYYAYRNKDQEMIEWLGGRGF
jgi:hypothetical protein